MLWKSDTGGNGNMWLKLGTTRGESCLFQKDVDLEVGGGSHLVMTLANDSTFLNTHMRTRNVGRCHGS